MNKQPVNGKQHRGIQQARGTMKEEDSSHDLFLTTLWDIIGKERTFIQSQMPRFNKMWNMHLAVLEPSPHQIRNLQASKEFFYENDVNKLHSLQNLEACLVDGYYVVKSIVDTLFNNYFNESALFLRDFNEEDRPPAKFLASEALLGALLQFLESEKNNIPLKYLIIAKNRAMLKLKGLSAKKIRERLESSGIESTIVEIREIMNRLIATGFASKKKTAKEVSPGKTVTFVEYKWIKEVKLSKEGEKFYNIKLLPLISWAVQLWRTMYNIRELDVEIPDTYKFRNFLTKTVAKAATQGFKNCYWVVKNLQKYYELIINEDS